VVVSGACAGAVTSAVASLTVGLPSYVQAVTNTAPVAYWRLDESVGARFARDFVSTNHGVIGPDLTLGVSGPQNPPFVGFETNNPAIQFKTAGQSFVTVPALNLNTNTVTILGWMYPTGVQSNYAGVAFCRAAFDNVTGVNFGYGGLNELHFTWNNNLYDMATGLRPPTNQWSFFALVITPVSATVYLGTNGVLNSFVSNNLSLPAQSFGSELKIGSDSYYNDRHFVGRLDEIAIYKRSLSSAEVQQLYSIATGVAPPSSPFESWQSQYFGCTNCPQAAANADPDGDGLNNLAEFQAGTNPTNSQSALRILSAVREGNDIRVTWKTAGGKTNALQALGGDYSTNFTDVGGLILVSGTGDTLTNRLDAGGSTNAPARFYRVRLVP
jgi:hypothetical protein